MKNIKFFISIIIIISTFLVGCSSYGTKFREEDICDGTKAIVYFYQPDNILFYFSQIRIFVDDEKIMDLKNNGYTRIYLSPSGHKITADLLAFHFLITLHSMSRTLYTKKRGTYFVKIYPRTRNGSQSTIEFMDENSAYREISSARYQARDTSDLSYRCDDDKDFDRY